jgi:hypothetical protein
MRAIALAAGLLAGAATLSTSLPAQPPGQPDPERPDVRRYERRLERRLERRDDDRRDDRQDDGDVIIRRGGPAIRFGEPGDLGVFRFEGQAERRSVVGIAPGRADTLGLRVDDVAADGPAAQAGIAAGDRLVAVNGTSLRLDRADVGDPLLAVVPARRLTRAVGRLAPGSEVELRFVRDGRERAVRIRTVAPAQVAELAPARGSGRDSIVRFRRTVPGRAVPGDARVEFFGPGGRRPIDDAAFEDLRRRARAVADSARVRIDERPVLGLTLGGTGGARDTLGLFVSTVVAGGPAERAGLVEGDRIAQVNSVDLRVPREERDAPEASAARRARFTREIERARPGDRLTLRVWGDGRWRTVTATVAKSGDVYRGASAVRMFGPRGEGGFGPGFGPEFGPAFGEGGLAPRAFEFRVAPPGAVGPGVPEIRELRRLRAPRAPLPPARPLRVERMVRM